MTRAGRRGDPGAAAGDLASGGVPPAPPPVVRCGLMLEASTDQSSWAGSRISSLVGGDHPRSAGLCSDLRTSGK